MAKPDDTDNQSEVSQVILEKQQALQHLHSNELARANYLLEKICSEHPEDHESWLFRGIVANRCGHRDAAVALFHRALTLKPDYPEAHQNLTYTLLAGSRHHELIEAARNALRYSPEDAELHSKLAIGLERTHQLEEAMDAAEKTLRIAPGHARAIVTLAKIEKQTGNLNKARERLEILQYTKLAPHQMCAVLGELGDVLDRLGDHTSAYYAFHSSNKAMLQMINPEQNPSTTIFDTISNYRKVFTADFICNWIATGPDIGAPSPIFLVGFPRSGTTLTEQIIIASGNIAPTDEEPIIYRLIKEIPIVLGRSFSYPEDLAGLSPEELATLRVHYWVLACKMVNAEIGNKRLLDKLPLNLIEVGFISRLFPDSPLVVVLRDPRDCCLSCYMRAFAPNQAMVNFSTIEDAARFYSAVMDYWLQIRPLLSIKYLEVHYEDLVYDLEGSTRTLIEHIGGEWNDSVLRFFEQSGKRTVRTPSYSDISQPIFNRAVGRWRNYELHMKVALEILQPYVKEFGYDE